MSLWDSICKKFCSPKERKYEIAKDEEKPKRNFIEEVCVHGKEQDFVNLSITLANFTAHSSTDWELLKPLWFIGYSERNEEFVTLYPYSDSNIKNYTFYALDWIGKTRTKIFEAVEQNSKDPTVSLLAADLLLAYNPNNQELQNRVRMRAEAVSLRDLYCRTQSNLLKKIVDIVVCMEEKQRLELEKKKKKEKWWF